MIGACWDFARSGSNLWTFLKLARLRRSLASKESQWVQTKCLGRCHWCHGNLACLKFQLFCALPILPYPSYHPLAGAQPRTEEKGRLWTCFASFRACWMGGAGHFQRSGPCHCNGQPWLKFATFEIWEPGKMINFKVVLIEINWRLGQLSSHSAKTPWRCVLLGKGRCRPWREVELEAVCKTWGHAAELQASHKGHENKKLDPNQKAHFQTFLLQHVAIKLLFPAAGRSFLWQHWYRLLRNQLQFIRQAVKTLIGS